MSGIETVRLLLFRGKWENEGVISALETSKEIIIFSAGQDYFSDNAPAQQIGKDYLKERKEKIKGIIVKNTNFRNVDLLESVCQEIGFNIPIYASQQSKIILNNKFPRLRNKIQIVEEDKEYKIGEFSLFFLPCNSYVVGNLGVLCNRNSDSFYFFEDFYFNALTENETLTKENFFDSLEKFSSLKKKNCYLITSFQNIHWSNNNSLYFAKNRLPTTVNEIPFFILYDFDWLHILEILELVFSWKKKIIILNNDFLILLKKILGNNHLKKVVTTLEETKKNHLSDSIYLLVTNPSNLIETVDFHLRNFPPTLKSEFHFVLGLPPVVSGEEKLADLLSYLYEYSTKITDLSKDREGFFRLGVSFFDLQTLLKKIRPLGTIAFNVSYKNKDILSHLRTKLVFLDNNHYWDVSSRKLAPCSSKRTLVSLDQIIIEQRQRLKQNGLLIICLIAFWKDKALKLKKIHLENIAVTFLPEETEKIEAKIKKWWDTKLVDDIKPNDPIKSVKPLVERRLNNLVKNFVSREYGNDLEEIVTLLFIQEKREREERLVENKELEH